MTRIYTCQACLNDDHERCEGERNAPIGTYGGSRCNCNCQPYNPLPDKQRPMTESTTPPENDWHKIERLERENATLTAQNESVVKERDEAIGALEKEKIQASHWFRKWDTQMTKRINIEAERDAATAQIEAAQRERERLVEALKRYGRHDDDVAAYVFQKKECRIHDGGPDTCDCGFDAALKGQPR